jgi:hypothetical protein
MKLSYQQNLASIEGIWLAERDRKTRPVERTGCPSSRPLPAKHMTYMGQRKEVNQNRASETDSLK